MDIHGHRWLSMYVHGHPWLSMDIHGYPWISMATHGYPWIYIDIHGYPRISMDIHGYSDWYPWISIDIHGLSRIFFVTKRHAAWIERNFNQTNLHDFSCVSLSMSKVSNCLLFQWVFYFVCWELTKRVWTPPPPGSKSAFLFSYLFLIFVPALPPLPRLRNRPPLIMYRGRCTS